jgi:nitrate reductase cytochrome c-type subunit
MIVKNQNLPITNNSNQSRICVKLCHDFCQAQHIDKKMLNYNHFIEQVKQFFTNLHPKHFVQCFGGDALK